MHCIHHFGYISTEFFSQVYCKTLILRIHICSAPFLLINKLVGISYEALKRFEILFIVASPVEDIMLYISLIAYHSIHALQ